jgi:hypothetical protein
LHHKIHGPKLKFLKTKEMRQNTKIMGPIKIHEEEGKFSPRHKYNVELGCATSKNIRG